jgi:hypothetical protein
MWSY